MVKNLASIPLVLPFAKWVWEAADNPEEVSPDICLSEVPFLSPGCFSALLAKALGVAIILGSCVNKVPLIMNMQKSKSADGISRNSLYGEALVYAACVFYGLLHEYPFSSYGENASLLIQNFVLIAMAWNLSATPVLTQEKVISSGGFVAFSIAVMYLLPEDLRYLLMSGTWPVMIYARGSQILETFQVKHTGNLSIVTTSMNLVGSLIRVGTTVQETGDVVILAGYILSFLLSFAMFVQYFLYLKNTREFATKSKKD
ncbi:unnamed protein product [Cylindrotheca closterium]|uniref:Solute carrier family 66 member 3 n=1 Tax=Cylindrotheca closterium TaxID=2856 RepID=A0AAD2FUG3_9STRA|nr:unnamed protein product [Cylindrotheca closterium]